MAVSGGIGKPGSITPLKPGSSITTICRQPGSASATHCRTVRRCSRTARTATSKASAGGAPRRARARPMVTGPTTCHLIGPCRPTAAARNARRPPNASWSRSSTTAASGSRRSTSTRTSPSRRRRCPARRRGRGRGSARPASDGAATGRRAGPGGARARSPRQRRHRCGAGSPLPWPCPPDHGTCIAPPPSVRSPHRSARVRHGGESMVLSANLPGWTGPCSGWPAWRGCSLPVTVGAAAARAGSGTSRPIHAVAAVELWALWAVGLVAALVPTTASLTVLRPARAGPAAGRRPRARRGAEPASPRSGLVVGAVVGGRGRSALASGRVLLPGLGVRRRGPLPAPPSRRPRPRARCPSCGCFMAPPIAGGPLLLAAGRGPRRRRDAHRRPGAGRAPPPLPPAVPPVPRLRARPGLVLHDHLVLAETALFRWVEVRSVERALSGHDRARPDRRCARRRARGHAGWRADRRARRRTSPDGRRWCATAAFLCRPTLLDDGAGRSREPAGLTPPLSRAVGGSGWPSRRRARRRRSGRRPRPL